MRRPFRYYLFPGFYMPLQTGAAVSPGRAMLAFSLGTLFFAYAFIQRVTPSVITGELMRDFAVGGTVLGSLSAFYFYAYASLQIPVGMLIDRFGPRKLMSVAAALCAIASLVFALSDSLWVALLGRAMIGATVAFAFVGTMAIAGYWFSASRYAMLAGFLQTVGMFGAVFGQAPMRLLVESTGWRGSLQLLAILALVLAVSIYFLVPHRPQRVLQQKRPSGLLPGLGPVVRNGQTWICSYIGFGMTAIMLAFGGLWGVPWAQSVGGYSATEAAGIVSMIFLGWAIFSPLHGWLSDHLGRRNPIIRIGALVLLVSGAWLFYATPTSTPLLMLLIFVTGAAGGAMTVSFGSVRELNDPAYSSTSLGLMNMHVVGAGAVMQPLLGWLLDSQWDGTVIDGARIYSAADYQFAFGSLLLVTAMALVLSFLLRETYCEQQVRHVAADSPL